MTLLEPPEHWIRVEEIEPGVFAVLDQDGEDLCGPFSNREDAEWVLREIDACVAASVEAAMQP